MPWREHLQKAQANLRAAEVCEHEGLADPAVSRAYFSVFHAAIAALMRLTDVRARSEGWDHAEVQAEFNRRLIIRQKVFSAALGRIPADLINYRHVADYRRSTVGKKVARRCLEKARLFVTTVQNRLREEPSNAPGTDPQ